MGEGARNRPSDKLLLNKFFDWIIPPMRTSKIQNGRQRAPKWSTGSGKVCTPRSRQRQKKMKKGRKTEYVQRCVCFVNIQVPRPHSNIYVKLRTSRLCMKMSSFLFVRALAMPHILYLSCGVLFPVWTPYNISGLISVALCLSRWEVIKKNSGNILLKWGGGGQIFFLKVFFVF